ncbi:MAG: hypothetical protein ACOYBJ_00890 [Patescibacteria group bacterium]|jgi:primosomal protein N'
MVYADIVIDAPSPKILSYGITPEHLPSVVPGQLVEVPLGNRAVMGIVWALRKRLNQAVAPTSIRPLNRVLSNGPWADPSTRKLAELIAHETDEPIGTCLFRLLPPPGKRSIPTLTGELTPSSRRGTTYHVIAASRLRTKTYVDLIVRAHRSGEQSLIVAPLHRFGDLQNQLSSTELLVTSVSAADAPTSQRRTASAFAKGEIDVLIATRHAAGWPAARLGLVIVDDALHPAHVDDQRPYLDTASLATLRQQAAPHVHLLIGSGVASSGMVRAEQTGRARRLQSAEPSTPVLLAKLPANRLLTDAADRLLDSASPDRPVVCIAPAHGVGGSLRCSACDFIFRCPVCSALPQLTRASTSYHCRTCGDNAPWPDRCPSCRSTTLVARGIGVEAVTEAIATQRGGTLPAGVRVTTELAIAELTGTESVIFTFADSPLIAPDLRRGERFLSAISDAIGQATRVIIQTTEPSAIHWRLLGRGRAEAERELLTGRGDYQLPPFRRRITAWGPKESTPALTPPEHATAYDTTIGARHAIIEWLVEPRFYLGVLQSIRAALPRDWRVRIDSVLEHSAW